jgi:hypothetical protein
MDLAKIAQDKIREMGDSGKIKELVEEGVEKALTGVINDMLSSYGPVTKELKETIKSGLKINPDQIDFSVYNKQMTVLVNQRLGNMFAGRAQDRFMKEVEKVLEPAPEKIDIGCLVKKVVGFWAADQADYWEDDVLECAVVEMEKSDIVGGWGLKLRKEKREYGKNNTNIDLYIKTDGSIGIRHGLDCNPTTLFSDADAFIFKLYAAGTLITGAEDYDPDDHEDDFQIHDRSGCYC